MCNFQVLLTVLTVSLNLFINAQITTPSSTGPARQFVAGDRIFGRKSDGLYYRGTVTNVRPSAVSVSFEIGESADLDTTSNNVVHDKINNPRCILVNSRLIAPWPSRSMYYPGRIQALDPVIGPLRVYVFYDDGEEGWASQSQLRLLPNQPPVSRCSYDPFDVNATLTATTPPPDLLRLVGTEQSNTGYPQIYHDGVWGFICDDDWGLEDANVVCTQLGYGGANKAHGSLYFGTPAERDISEKIWLDDVSCNGDERLISDCSHSGWGTHNCLVSELAAVECYKMNYDECAHGEDDCDENAICTDLVKGWNCTCKTGYAGNGRECQVPAKVRLVHGGGFKDRGYPQLWHDGEWGFICDDSWDIADGHVICRQVGFGAAAEVGSASHYGRPVEYPVVKHWLDDVECNGNEFAIEQCSHSGWGQHNCDSSEIASVKCYHPSYDECAHNEDDCTENADCTDLEIGWKCTCKAAFVGDGVYCTERPGIRLVSGGKNYGYIQIKYSDEWRYICETNWNPKSANVTCQQLGYTGAAYTVPGLFYGFPGEELPKYWIGDVQCRGNETNLYTCSHSSWGLVQGECSPLKTVGTACYNAGENECETGNNDCDDNAICKDLKKGWNCECKQGYLGNGRYCAEGPGVRLLGEEGYGYLQVEYQGKWTYVASYGWSKGASNVVCKQLGYSGAIDESDVSNLDRPVPCLIKNVNCVGNETNLFSCFFEVNSDDFLCYPTAVVTIFCYSGSLSAGSSGFSNNLSSLNSLTKAALVFSILVTLIAIVVAALAIFFYFKRRSPTQQSVEFNKLREHEEA